MTNLQNSPESSADFQEVLYKVRHFLQYILSSFQMQRERWVCLPHKTECMATQTSHLREFILSMIHVASEDLSLWLMTVVSDGDGTIQQVWLGRAGWRWLGGSGGFMGGWWMMLIGRERCETGCVISRAGGRPVCVMCVLSLHTL